MSRRLELLFHCRAQHVTAKEWMRLRRHDEARAERTAVAWLGHVSRPGAGREADGSVRQP
jgi:hypothetical protein